MIPVRAMSAAPTRVVVEVGAGVVVRDEVAIRVRYPWFTDAMRVIVAGGHGQIGLRLLRLLKEHGDEGVGLIRNPDHSDDIRATGAEPLVLDLEAVEEVGPLEADAIVFAAGA